MKIVISSGHGLKVRGADGVLDEVDEARLVVEEVADNLLKLKCGVVTFHDDISTTKNENLETIVDFHNSQLRDLDVSVHFNAYCDTAKPMGTEVLYVSEADKAARVCNAICKAGFINRGAKFRSDLYFLNNTEMPAILIEVCFVDSVADAEIYNKWYQQICKLIAIAISGRQLMMPPAAPGLPHTVPDHQRDIIATVFGGSADPNCSAYDEEMMLNDTDLYVALPDRFDGERPSVVVYNKTTGQSAVADIWDVGPWNIDDPYWILGTRPQAESGTDMQGRTTNGAGIDLSPALAKAIGISGKGKVDWTFAP